MLNKASTHNYVNYNDGVIKMHQFSRNELAIGKDGMSVLKNATVVIVGVGGVGSYAAEALVRSGIGKIVLIDKDTIDMTNINRQIPALLSTVGANKVEIMQARMQDINPNCTIISHTTFINEANLALIFDYKPDFIVEAIDTIKIKGLIIKEALLQDVNIISSMGMANKMDPTQIKIVDIWQTKYDPLARIIRKTLKEARLSNKKLTVVCSEEKPIKQKPEIIAELEQKDSDIRKLHLPPSSNSFVPSVSGLFCASHVVNNLLASASIQINRLHDDKR